MQCAGSYDACMQADRPAVSPVVLDGIVRPAGEELGDRYERKEKWVSPYIEPEPIP